MRVSNKSARQAVDRRWNFKGSNTFGEWQGLAYKGIVYAVYSYGKHFPIYAYIGDTWYGNKDKYSVSTSRHQTQLRPSGDIEYVDTGTLKSLIEKGQSQEGDKKTKTQARIFNKQTRQYQTVEGRILDNFWEGYRFILHRWLDDLNLWVVSDYYSTAKITTGYKTQKEAKEKAIERLNKAGVELYKKQSKLKAQELDRLQNEGVRKSQVYKPVAQAYRPTEFREITTRFGKPITADLVLDMAKIDVLTTADFKDKA